MSAGRLRLSSALLLAGACVLAYANGLTGAFVYDDKAIVRDNPRIRTPQRVDEILTTQYFGGKRGTGTAYRPALLLSFAAQWWIHGGDPVAVSRRQPSPPRPRHAAARAAPAADRPAAAAAVGAALLFAVHPIHAEAVTSVVGRGETQAAALRSRIPPAVALRGIEGRGSRRLALVGALVLYLLANLTKESAAVAPALLFLLLAWRADGGLGRAAVRGPAAGLADLRRRGGGSRGRVPTAHARARRRDQGERHRASSRWRTRSLRSRRWSRAANACAIFLRYLWTDGLPAAPLLGRVGLVHPRPDPARCPLLGGAGPARRARRRRAPAPASTARRRPSAFSSCASPSLPTSNLLFPTGTIFAERLAYLPSAGFCLIAASWIVGRAPDLAALPRWRAGALAAVALLLAARTLVRNPVWSSDEALFTDMVRVSPESAKAHYDFAYMSAELASAGGRARALHARHADLSGVLGRLGGQGPRRADSRTARGLGALLRRVPAAGAGVRERMVRRRPRARGPRRSRGRRGRVPPGSAPQSAVASARVQDGAALRRRETPGDALCLAAGARDRSGLPALAAGVRGLARRRRPSRRSRRAGPRDPAAGAALQAGDREAEGARGRRRAPAL